MSGTYAHITLVNMLKEPLRLENIPGFPREAISAVLDHFKFCELGSISPDYPYLTIIDKNALAWSDAMHKIRTGEVIHAAIRNTKKMKGEKKRKCLAWALGYAAHMVTDVVVHPVVNLKVGDYKDNKTEHRICEMHQDAYIFRKLNLGTIGVSEHLDSGIGACSNDEDRDNIDKSIESLWRTLLREIYPEEYQSNTPNINKWHRSCIFLMDKIVEEGYRLLPLSRHILDGLGATYPNEGEIDEQYIESLPTPEGNLHYDDIFNKTIESTGQVWQLIASGVYEDNELYASRIGNWGFDSGKDGDGNYIFWNV